MPYNFMPNPIQGATSPNAGFFNPNPGHNLTPVPGWGGGLPPSNPGWGVPPPTSMPSMPPRDPSWQMGMPPRPGPMPIANPVTSMPSMPAQLGGVAPPQLGMPPAHQAIMNMIPHIINYLRGGR